MYTIFLLFKFYLFIYLFIIIIIIIYLSQFLSQSINSNIPLGFNFLRLSILFLNIIPYYLTFFLKKIHIIIVRTGFESLTQKMDGLRSKKPKTMNL